MHRSIQAHLPPELWFSIFSILSASDLLSIRLTSKLFSELSLPLLFTTLCFRPSLDDLPRAYEEMHNMMAFWSSDRIASYTLECEFTPFSFPSRNDSVWEMEMRDRTRFVEAFFEALVPFQNISTVKAQAIPFSDKALSDLCQLRSLKTLQVKDCFITATSNPGFLPIERFIFSSYTPIATAHDIGPIKWADVLVVPRLKHFEMRVSRPIPIMLRDIIPDAPQPLRDTLITAMNTFLKPARALESLIVAPFAEWREQNGTFPADFCWELPSLREYEGPRMLFDKFIVGNQLRKLYVRPFAIGQFLSLPEISTISETRPELTANLESLGLWVTVRYRSDPQHNPQQWLKIVQSNYPNLQELKIFASKDVDELRVDTNLNLLMSFSSR